MFGSSSNRRALASADPAVRRKAAQALGDARDARAVADLVAVLRQDSDASVREAAAGALGAIGAREAVPALLNTAERDPELTVRHGAMKALGRLGGDQAIDGIIAQWRIHRNTDDGAIHMSGGEALLRIGAPAVPALRRALQDPAWRVRWMAVNTLRQLRDTFARPDIERLLQDPHPMVRNEARAALDSR